MTDVVWKGAEALREHLRPLASLRENPLNAHEGDTKLIAASLQRFGQVRAVLIDEDDDTTLVAGHHVWRAAALIGWSHVAAIPAKFATAEDRAAYLLADNETAKRGRDNREKMATLYDAAAESGSLEGTGITEEDIATAKAMDFQETEMARVDDLVEHPENYREHTEEQLAHLTESLQEHGYFRNVVVANDGTILAGHGIMKAARKIGARKIPVTRMDYGPDDPRAKKLLAADNELGKLAKLDDRQLSMILKDVADGNPGALLGTGYDAKTLATLVMISRDESEIAGFEEAAEWVGLPGFEEAEDRFSLVLNCDTEQERDALAEALKVTITRGDRRTRSANWPPQEKTDLSSLRFEVGVKAGS